MLALKQYELSNHLGNVLATVSDRKTPVIVSSAVTGYKADVVSAQYYYPFGSTMPEHTFLAQQNLILNENFASGVTGWSANLASGYTLTQNSGRLKFTSTFEYSGPYKAFATIPGKRYRIKFTLDRDNTPAVAFVARDD